jgi:predicted RNA methylase
VARSNEYQLTPEVRAVLGTSLTDHETLKLPEQLDRKLYVAVNKAIELMGGKWDRKRKLHVFADDNAYYAVTDALATGTVIDLKKTFQFYETPQDVAEQLVKLADPQPSEHVLEPSAGRGAILRALRKLAPRSYLHACELMDKNRAYLTEAFADSVVIQDDDFLLHAARCAPTPPYDCVIANPPFARGQDMRHVLHMLDVVRPGGRIVSVMSPAWEFHSSALALQFRNAFRSNLGDWTTLPDGSFKESGTSVRAGIMQLRRVG